MHIIGILGSPKGKNSLTLKLLESALNGAEDAGAEVEFIDVARKNIRTCKSCGICYATGKCSQKDDFQAVYEKVVEADGIIFASPVYFNNVSSQLKALYRPHRGCEALHAVPGQVRDVRRYDDQFGR